MNAQEGETIYALASAAGRAGVAVFRISGVSAGEVFGRLCGVGLPSPRVALRVRLRDPMSGEIVDDGLALWFPAPRSFTGENVVELQMHGGRASVTAVLRLLSGMAGFRLAEAGEFARRAFENGKLDLTAAEGLADLIDAETEAQRRQARRQFEGALGRLYEDWRQRLLESLAHVEAEIDFGDDEVPTGLAAAARDSLEDLAAEMARHLADEGRGERLRVGVSVAIIGPANAGKSSLINAIARRDVAIVAAEAGTTRDVIEVHLDLGGFPVTIADTAGLREATSLIEAEGMRRALARAADADIKLLVVDASQSLTDPVVLQEITPSALVILNKSDVAAGDPPAAAKHWLRTSALTGDGVDSVLKWLEESVCARFDITAAPMITQARHREAIVACRGAVLRAVDARHIELLAEELRFATRQLGIVTGRVGVEDVLDVIFKQFCIGK